MEQGKEKAFLALGVIVFLNLLWLRL